MYEVTLLQVSATICTCHLSRVLVDQGVKDVVPPVPQPLSAPARWPRQHAAGYLCQPRVEVLEVESTYDGHAGIDQLAEHLVPALHPERPPCHRAAQYVISERAQELAHVHRRVCRGCATDPGYHYAHLNSSCNSIG